MSVDFTPACELVIYDGPKCHFFLVKFLRSTLMFFLLSYLSLSLLFLLLEKINKPNYSVNKQTNKRIIFHYSPLEARRKRRISLKCHAKSIEKGTRCDESEDQFENVGICFDNSPENIVNENILNGSTNGAPA